MKKIISVLLSVIMLLSCLVPAFAQDEGRVYVDANGRSKIPIITVSGDGAALYDKDGNRVLHYKSLVNSSGGSSTDIDTKNIIQSVVNVLNPFLVEGIAQDKWDNYYAALQDEIDDLTAPALLDENGDSVIGTDIEAAYYKDNEYCMHTDKKYDGTYGSGDYTFHYDWRLDPMETAEKLHAYIAAVKEVTGASKVGLISRCIGTSVAAAYVAKYGMDDFQGIAFNGSTVSGSEVLSEAISGKFVVNANAINRFLTDCNALGFFSVDEFLTDTIDLLDKSGVLDTVVGVTKETIYDKVVQGVTSALALSTFYTWPSYWAGVSSADYQDALNYVFGAEGSEKRVQYAGLIAKLDNYDVNVRQRLPEIFKTIDEEGNLCLISKYGYQLAPISVSCDEVSDQLATVKSSSRGATTATVYGTLSDEYIADRTEKGLERYISPDKQIDASTCEYPDYTWFVKGATHSRWTYAEDNVCIAVISADRQLTVNDLACTQFMVWSNDTETMYPMTTENCDCYHWTASEAADNPSGKMEALISFITSLIRWLQQLYIKLAALVAKNTTTVVA